MMVVSSLLQKKSLRLSIMVVIDVILLFVSSTAALFIRFDGDFALISPRHILVLFLCSVIFIIPLFAWQKLYAITLSFVSLRDLYRLAKACFLSSLLIAISIITLRDYRVIEGFPRSALLINTLLFMFLLGGFRISKRVFLDVRQTKTGKRILIIGAGKQGEELARKLIGQRESTLIGFLDDNPAKKNSHIHGFPVLGSRKDLPLVHKKYAVDEIIIALPSEGANTIKETVQLGREHHIHTIKILPSIAELLDGKYTLHDIRDITVKDLLRRNVTQFNFSLVREFLKGKRVCITGAAGSIGQELLKKTASFEPAHLTAIDQDETGIFRIGLFMKETFPALAASLYVANICDKRKMQRIFEKHRPDIVFHAAAYKHVPVMEEHPDESVKTNIFGTRIIADCSIEKRVSHMILISTDKAVEPTTVMGTTKRYAEHLISFLGEKTNEQTTRFSIVRFGNVIDSRGNVFEVFKNQIKRGGPLEITHPEMKRFFMLTEEAVMLVLEAASLSKGNELFLLDMGEPVRILDLAQELIRLSGFEPDKDIPIVFTKPRSGEKMVEVLVSSYETLRATRSPKIFTVHRTQHLDEDLFVRRMAELLESLEDSVRLREILFSPLHSTLPSQPKTVKTPS